MTGSAPSRPRGRKQKMAARATAEREGLRAARREVETIYLLVYRARGHIGRYPLATLTTPGLIDWSTLPVVGR